MLTKISKILIVFFLFFNSYRISNIPVSIIIVILSLILFSVYKVNKTPVLFVRDNIKKILLVMLLISIGTYIFRAGNAESVSRIYSYKSGEAPTFLYLKMSLNGLLLFLTIFLGFSMGLSYNGNPKLIKNLLRFLINILAVYALVNVFSWLQQTGGLIGRYNYEPVLSSSFGIIIQWSILGFMLQLSQISNTEKLIYKIIRLFIFLISIIIVLSRENQILFILMVLLYFYYIKKNKNGKLIILSLTISLIIGFFFIQSNIAFSAFNSYGSMFNSSGDDLTVRFDLFKNGMEIFKKYPFFGIGYGMFAGYSTVLVYISGVGDSVSSTHNGLAAILSEMGIVGLFLNIALIYKIITRLLLVRNKLDTVFQSEKNGIAAIFVFITVYLISSLSSNYFLIPPPSEYNYYGIAFISWLLIGTVLSNNVKILKTKISK